MKGSIPGNGEGIQALRTATRHAAPILRHPECAYYFAATAPGVCLLLCCILVQLVFDGIDEGEPARFDDVLADADRAPDIVVVGGLDDDADAGGSAGLAVDDA